ncbi:MAG TPA: hypothetical protein VGT07_11335, partial [Steroidobacteraceae bacterium]|nr:hypothetical protein [Steroidobacteraceae bacterium]
EAAGGTMPRPGQPLKFFRLRLFDQLLRVLQVVNAQIGAASGIVVIRLGEQQFELVLLHRVIEGRDTAAQGGNFLTAIGVRHCGGSQQRGNRRETPQHSSHVFPPKLR